MWRPKNWELCTIDNLTNYEGLTHAQCYEAGADAILEALKEDGEYLHNTGTMPYGFVLGRSLKSGEKGWLVFIPEEL